MIFELEMCALEAKSNFSLNFVLCYVNKSGQLLQTNEISNLVTPVAYAGFSMGGGFQK